MHEVNLAAIRKWLHATLLLSLRHRQRVRPGWWSTGVFEQGDRLEGPAPGEGRQTFSRYFFSLFLSLKDAEMWLVLLLLLGGLEGPWAWP